MLKAKKKLETAEQKMNWGVNSVLHASAAFLCVSLFSRGEHPLPSFMTQSLSSGTLPQENCRCGRGLSASQRREKIKAESTAGRRRRSSGGLQTDPRLFHIRRKPSGLFLAFIPSSFHCSPVALPFPQTEMHTAEQANQIFSKSTLKASFWQPCDILKRCQIVKTYKNTIQKYEVNWEFIWSKIQ